MSNIYITFIALVFVRETVVTRLAEKRRACREGHGVNIKMDKLPFWGLTAHPNESSTKLLRFSAVFCCKVSIRHHMRISLNQGC